MGLIDFFVPEVKLAKKGLADAEKKATTVEQKRSVASVSAALDAMKIDAQQRAKIAGSVATKTIGGLLTAGPAGALAGFTAGISSAPPTLLSKSGQPPISASPIAQDINGNMFLPGENELQQPGQAGVKESSEVGPMFAVVLFVGGWFFLKVLSIIFKRG